MQPLLLNLFYFGLLLQLRISVALQTPGSCFTSDVTKWLDAECVNWKNVAFPLSDIQVGNNQLLSLVEKRDSSECRIFLHILPSPRSSEECYAPTLNRKLTEYFSQKDDVAIIHLHQDVWESKQQIVQSRLLTRIGRIQSRVFARKTSVRRIQPAMAKSFLEQNHLWSATKAKYSYGLFSSDEQLLAVATFSPRRKVIRNQNTFNSHELLRFCSALDTVVIGGLSKLVKAFIQNHNPDDLVTVIDRDWGSSGGGWHKLGFETVSIMAPLAMAVQHINKKVQRHHLVGAGIVSPLDNLKGQQDQQERVGLPLTLLEQLDSQQTCAEALCCLEANEFYPVYDVGVERLFLIVKQENQKHLGHSISPRELWKKSVPTYSSSYYSRNKGIAAILKSIEL